MRYAEGHAARQIFDASDPQENFFSEKTKKTIFRYGRGESENKISGLYHFSFGQEAWQTMEYYINWRGID